MSRPDASYLRSALDYNAATGVLRWKWRADKGLQANRHFAGKTVSSTTRKDGKLYVSINGRKIASGRLIWCYVHGAWPMLMVDHANGIATDNRLSNLRLATRAQNGQNRRKQKNNTTGVTGIYTDAGKWRASIKKDGATYNLGTFSDFDAAAAARVRAEARLHGEFASYERHSR